MNLKTQLNEEILVVEDDIANQQVALLLLKKFGYQTALAANGKIAIELTKKQKYSMILMDCQMPIMNGFDTSLAIRKTVGLNQNTPIVALTANLVAGVSQDCYDSGMDDILNKPVMMNDLKAIVEKWLGKSSNDQLANQQET